MPAAGLPSSAPREAVPVTPLTTAEDAQDFLSRQNFKSLIEWITAETILSRPDDPLEFVKRLVDTKITERSGKPYKPQDATDYVRECYAEASASADENGRIHTKSLPPASMVETKPSASSARLAYLEECIKVCRKIAMQTDPKEAEDLLIQELLRILQAERATIYTMNEAGTELRLLVAEGAKDIRVKVGHSIAGTVAQSKEILNIPDAHKDPRFDTHYDEITNFRSKAVLAAPITDGKGNVVGVVQVINRLNSEPFTAMDEEIISILASQAGIAIQNTKLLQDAMKNHQKVQYILEVIQAIQTNVLGPTSLMFTIQQRAPALAEADRCTLFLADRKSNSLISVVGDVNIAIPLNEGIAGAVATSGEVINIADCYSDPRFSPAVDKETGYLTRNMLCMPIFGSDNSSIIGVLQLINKSNSNFDQEDERVIGIFLKSVGVILEQSSLMRTSNVPADGDEATGKLLLNTGGKVLAIEPSIAETDEEDEGRRQSVLTD